MKNSCLKSKFYEKEEVRTYIQEAVLDRIDDTKYGVPYVTVGTAHKTFNLYTPAVFCTQKGIIIRSKLITHGSPASLCALALG